MIIDVYTHSPRLATADLKDIFRSFVYSVPRNIFSMPKQSPITIDGTTLEGGGQILRLALALSSLTQKPINLYDIRGKRGAGGKEGGIKQAHLGGAAWLARAAEASTEGLTLKSRGLLFEPGLGTPQEIKDAIKQVNKDGVGIGKALRFVPGVNGALDSVEVLELD